MGDDADYVILDKLANEQGLFWRQRRTLIAGTRARSSFIMVGFDKHFPLSKFIDSKTRLQEG